MKKKIIAALVAAALTIACLPVLSGCSADVNYDLKTDKDGTQYYSIKCSGYTSSLKGEFEIPSTYNDLPVREIESEAFSGTSITKVTIPATVKKVGSMAFGLVNSLKEVVFEEGSTLESIGVAMFYNCTSLESIDIPESVVNVWHNAFEGCTRLKSVTLHDGLDYIGNAAFRSCWELKEISLPQTLSNIGYEAFYLTGLKSIVIPDSVHAIEEESVDENGEVVKTEVPAIGYAAFHSCNELEFAVVGSGVTELLSGTFGYCPKLERIYLPASLKKVEGALYIDGEFYYGHPFHNDNSLKHVYYSGTAEEWAALVPEINDEKISEGGAVFDNSALIKAEHHYGQTYNP